jgi:PAS domain S-box-containing protein
VIGSKILTQEIRQTLEKKRTRILFIEDDPVDREKTLRYVSTEKLPYDLILAETVFEALSQIQKEEFDLMLIDYLLPDGTGLEIQEQAKGIPCIFLTAVSEINLAVQAMQAGAYSYLVKDLSGEYLKLLHVSIEKALQRKQVENELERYRFHLEEEVQLRTIELQRSNDQLNIEIAERGHTQEALRKSERRYQQIFETNQAIKLIINPSDGQIIQANEAACEFYGYDAQTLTSMQIMEINTASDEEVHQEMEDAKLEKRLYFNFGHRLASGEIRDVEVYSGPVQIGEKTLLYSIIHDVTERKQVEDSIQQYIQQLAALRLIDQAISGSFDLRFSLNILLEQLLAQLGVDAAAVLQYNQDLQLLTFSQGRGFQTSALQNTNLRLGEGLAGEVALQRQPVFIPNLNHYESNYQESPQFARERFVAYYGIPLISKGKLVGTLEIYNRSPFDPNNEWVEFLTTLASQAAIAIDNATLFNDLQSSTIELALAYNTTLEGWAHALEMRDVETEGHSRRVTEMTIRLAEAMDINKDEFAHIRRGALLHDIGKMGISDKIILKPGPLDEEEWEIMRQHPVNARELLKPIAYLAPALAIPYCHHEKWDGSGYPQGLSGEEIPLAARIFAIVDVWDALLSKRPYRAAWPEGKIVAHIKDQSGKHFDPNVTAAFIKILNERTIN